MELDLESFMAQARGFDVSKQKLRPHYTCNHKPTLVIDVLETLITEIEISSKENLEQLRELQNFETNYIILTDYSV